MQEVSLDLDTKTASANKSTSDVLFTKEVELSVGRNAGSSEKPTRFCEKRSTWLPPAEGSVQQQRKLNIQTPAIYL